MTNSLLQNPKSEGGLNLVNLKNRDKALKATWPQVLEKEKEYANLVYKIIGCEVVQGDIWRCRLHPERVQKMKFSNLFWFDTIEA